MTLKTLLAAILLSRCQPLSIASAQSSKRSSSFETKVDSYTWRPMSGQAPPASSRARRPRTFRLRQLQRLYEQHCRVASASR